MSPNSLVKNSEVVGPASHCQNGGQYWPQSISEVNGLSTLNQQQIERDSARPRGLVRRGSAHARINSAGAWARGLRVATTLWRAGVCVGARDTSQSACKHVGQTPGNKARGEQTQPSENQCLRRSPPPPGRGASPPGPPLGNPTLYPPPQNPPPPLPVKSTPPSAATASPERVPSTTTESSPKTISKSHTDEVPATTTPQTTPLTSLITGTASKTDCDFTLSETRSENINETNPKNGEEIRDLIAQNETQDESASEIKADVPDNVVGNGQDSGFKTVGDGETKKGVRTVVKRTVRVVKKVVKKKVPKRVQRGQAVSLSEESGKVDNENGDFNPSALGESELENPNSVASDSLEVENFEPDPPASVSVGVENPNSDVAVSMEAEKPDSDPSSSNPLAVENYGTNIAGSMQLENPEEVEAEAVERKDPANENLSEAPVSDVIEPKNASNEGEQAVSGTETQLGDQNVGLITNQNDEIETENVDSGGGDRRGVKEEVENFDVGDWKGEVGMHDGVVWSGEMEALKRRKRRKTEIFVGGLHKDAKDEDIIRKVFQEVGAIVDVRLVMSDKIGKNKGFAFVRYASAADAKSALAKFSSVEIEHKSYIGIGIQIWMKGSSAYYARRFGKGSRRGMGKGVLCVLTWNLRGGQCKMGESVTSFKSLRGGHCNFSNVSGVARVMGKGWETDWLMYCSGVMVMDRRKEMVVGAGLAEEGGRKRVTGLQNALRLCHKGICGKECGAVPAEGNDTIFLGNIDKKWKSEDIIKLLQEIGIEKIDKVTVIADPSNIECNHGFAFLELETIRDAQNAYRKLQKKDIFGKQQKIKVAWAEPLSEPDEEEMLKVVID
ncbi:hypothetical protein Acr_00g0027810 [Actinidia rufa]|uniref:RRM domain-containing protein n=1 Tax=Actinidia rufa TaxID=165716 RepID=A0A7J0DE23_9ERIC|nr:hypothetical protein Acr_00g0027810 [Actinidia rufa]